MVYLKNIALVKPLLNLLSVKFDVCCYVLCCVFKVLMLHKFSDAISCTILLLQIVVIVKSHRL